MIYSYNFKEKWKSEGFQKYFKNTSWLFVSRIICMGISFIATAFIARSLGPTNFGQLSYAISFVAIFSFLPSLGIDPILYKELIKHRDKKESYLGTALGIKLMASIFTAALIITTAIFFTEDDVSKILIFILSSTFIFNSFLVINSEFQARVQSKYPAIISVAVILLLNIAKIAVILFDKGVIYLSLTLLLESVLYAVFYLYAYKKILKEKISNWKFDKELGLALLGESWPLIFYGAFLVIYSKIDQVLIKNMIDSHAVGVYDSAVRVAETWYFIPALLINSLFPAIVNANATSKHLYHSRIKKLFIFTFIFTFMISLLVAILAPIIMNILYGEEFVGGVKILQIYVWSSIPIAIVILMNNYLIIEKYRMILLASSFLPLLINIVLNLLWIPNYGIVGSAYATLVSYSFGPIVLIFFKETRQKIFSFLFR